MKTLFKLFLVLCAVAVFSKTVLAETMNNAQMTNHEVVILLGQMLGFSQESDAEAVLYYAQNYFDWFVEHGILEGEFVPEEYTMTNEYATLSALTLEVLENAASIETLMGVGNRGLVNGDIETVRFTMPQGISVSDDRVFVLDTFNNAIRTILNGNVSTLTGSAAYLDATGLSRGFFVDGNLSQALLNRPTSGVFNANGEFFFADSGNHVIRHVVGDRVYTFSGGSRGHRDGARNEARFNTPMAIATDDAGNIYVADTLNHVIRMISAEGRVSTIAGIPGREGYNNGGRREALFREPAGISVNGDGSVIYVSDTGNHVIRRIENGIVTTAAGVQEEFDEDFPLGGFRNGEAALAQFSSPRGIIIVDGSLIIADSGNHRIRAINPSGEVITLAGNGEPGDNDGFALGSVINGATDIHYHNGQLFIADTGNNKLKILIFV